MPSSSNGSTHAETALITHFRRVFVHLGLSDRKDEREFLIDRLVETLELSDTDLQHELYPSTLPLSKRARAQCAVDNLEKLSRESRAMKLCDRICDAGTACGDIGWFLKQVGRTKEGEQWCEYDSHLNWMACKVFEEEKAREAAIAAEEGRRAAQREQMQLRVRRAQVQRSEVIELD